MTIKDLRRRGGRGRKSLVLSDLRTDLVSTSRANLAAFAASVRPAPAGGRCPVDCWLAVLAERHLGFFVAEVDVVLLCAGKGLGERPDASFAVLAAPVHVVVYALAVLCGEFYRLGQADLRRFVCPCAAVVHGVMFIIWHAAEPCVMSSAVGASPAVLHYRFFCPVDVVDHTHNNYYLDYSSLRAGVAHRHTLMFFVVVDHAVLSWKPSAAAKALASVVFEVHKLVRDIIPSRLA